jgi:uncharacterized membrane protein
MRKKEKHLLNEFTVLGSFAAVVLAGLAIGAVSLIANPPKQLIETAVPAGPSVSDYRSEVRQILMPFLQQVVVIEETGLPEGASETLSNMVSLTQERMLDLTVPAGEREAHLSMVILLDQWTRALSGVNSDLSGVISRTSRLMLKYPWLK